MTGAETDGRTRRAAEAREQRRAQILESALEVFSAQGYHQASVSDLVTAAGVARGTFYLYFDSKQAIFHELLDDLLAHLRANVVGVDTSPGAAPVRAQLMGTVGRLLDTVDANRAFVHILLREAVGLDAEVDDKLAEFYGNLHLLLDQSLRQGQRMGVVRADVDTEVVAACILGSIKEVLERWLVQSDDPIDTERLAAAVLDHALRGVAPPGTGTASP